jgi:hypothetical protein
MSTTYAVLDSNNTVVNMLTPDPGDAIDPSWVVISGPPFAAWTGWTTTDGGATWTPPASGS